MGKLEKYSSYKDSKVDWIGEIPGHWKIQKIKFIMNKIQTGTTPSTSNKKFFGGELNWFNPKDLNQEVLIESENKLSQLALDRKEIKLFPKDSILIVGIGATTGKTSYLTIEGTFNQQITGFNSKIHDNKFLFYALRSYSNVFLNVASYTTLPILNNEFFKSFSVVLPPQNEQIKIAEYLDNKTSQIDNAISQKENLIELLKEQKQITINDAVTKGLNKDIEFIDSDVEWIGKIPKHWNLLANKFIFKIKKDIVGKRSKEFDLLSLTLQGIIKRDLDKGGKFPAEFDTYQEVKEDDFVFCLFDVEETPRTIGLSEYNGMITGAYTVMNAKSINKKYLYYFYLNLDSKKRLKSLYKGLRNTISKDTFFSFKTFIPPKEEQLQIVEYIENQTTKIDKVIELQQNYILKLKEYKVSLIDSVVTGKVKVM